jgi:hypothetical protein
MLDDNYNATPDEMAKLLLETVMDCEVVEVHTLSGQGVAIRRTGALDER